MRSLPSATTVCRVLIGLDRAGASGTLHIDGESRHANLWLESGELVAANIDRRVASSHRHLFEGVLQVCRWDRLVLRLTPERSQASCWKLAQPLAARQIALETMRAALGFVDPATIRSELASAAYHLTPTGELLLRGASLQAEEAAVLPWLVRGVPAEQISRLPGCGLATYRFVWMLKLLRAVAPKAGGSSYPLLLRKRRELRRRAPAHTLLDLPEGADGRAARMALRRLVRELHPDRFGEGAPAELRRASGEIVTALIEAESKIAMEAIE
jgi:hypothetical protein